MLRAGMTFLSLISFLAMSCDLVDPCGNSEVLRLPSPGGRAVAWIFVRDCGATTGYSVHVSVLPTSSTAPRDGGNAFIIGQRSGVSAEWGSPQDLTISYKPAGEIFKKESRVGEVSVTYRER
jgi:hypothetical protein